MRIRSFAHIATMVAVLALGSVSAGATDLPFKIGGPFQLVDSNGRTVTESSFPGQHLLVYFGYTYCPDICPSDLARLSTALDSLAETALRKVQPLFISVDPARDSPTIVGDFARAFHPAIIGLTGSETQVAAATRVYRVHRMKIPMPEFGPEEYLVNHTPNAYLIAPDGGFLTLFPHNSQPEFITEILAKYLGLTGESG